MNLKIRPLSDWEHLQLGILLFPSIPLFGVINVLIATVKIWRSHYQDIIRNPINRIWGVFSVCLVINCFFAHNLPEAIGGLFNLLPFIGLFAATNVLITTPNQLYQIAKITWIGGIPIHVLGLAQSLLGWQFKINILIASITLEKYDGSRVTSLFDNPNIFGFYAVITLIMTLIIWDAMIHQIEMTKISFNHLFDRFFKTKWGAIFSLATTSLLLNTINLVMTQSRVVLILSFLIFIGYFVHRNWRWASGFASVFTSGILLAGYTDSAPSQIARKIIPEIFWKRLQEPYPKDFPVEIGRPAIWQFASNLTQERPLTGWGLRNFSGIFQERVHSWIGHQHNLVLMLSSEIGIPLTLFFVGIMLLLFQQSLSIIQRNQLCPETSSRPIRVSHNANTTYSLYLMFCGAWVILNTVDITLFNLTLNTFAWLIFGSMSGVAGNFGVDRCPSWIQRIQTRISFL